MKRDFFPITLCFLGLICPLLFAFQIKSCFFSNVLIKNASRLDFFFHCAGREAMSGQVRLVICGWIWNPSGCGRALRASSASPLPPGRLQRCRLEINSGIFSLLCTEGLTAQVSIPSSEDFFSASYDFYFSISFLPGQPCSLPGFLPLLKEEKCSIADVSQVKARG